MMSEIKEMKVKKSDVVVYAVEDGKVIVGVSISPYTKNVRKSMKHDVAEEAFIVARDTGRDYYIGNRLAGFVFDAPETDEQIQATIARMLIGR